MLCIFRVLSRVPGLCPPIRCYRPYHLPDDIYMWFQMLPDVPWAQVILAETGSQDCQGKEAVTVGQEERDT